MMNSKRVARELEFFNATHFHFGVPVMSRAKWESDRFQLSAHFVRAIYHGTEDVKDVIDAAARAMVVSNALNKRDQSAIACAFVSACAGEGKNPNKEYAAQVLNKVLEEKPEVEGAVIAAFLLPVSKAPATYSEVRDLGTGNVPKISPY
jgi:hypothetical protein